MSSATSKASFAAALWLAVAMVAGARDAAQESIEGLRLNLTLGDEFSLHEPIVAVLRLQSDSGHTVQIDLGLNHKGALVFTFTQPDGHRMVRCLPEDFDGFGEIGQVTLKPGESYHEGLVLNDWQGFDQLGTYQFQMAVTTTGPTASRSAPALMAAGSFHVTPADSSRLETACGHLAVQALGMDLVAARDAAHALSYANDKVCLPALLQVLAGCFVCREDILLAMARIGTPQAAKTADSWNRLDDHSRKAGRKPPARTSTASKPSSSSRAATASSSSSTPPPSLHPNECKTAVADASGCTVTIQ